MDNGRSMRAMEITPTASLNTGEKVVLAQRAVSEGWGGERPGALLARRTEEGMESDDLLCSRNARPEKALVGRAQWKINQAPSLKR
jgi:hypothetical protein